MAEFIIYRHRIAHRDGITSSGSADDAQLKVNLRNPFRAHVDS